MLMRLNNYIYKIFSYFCPDNSKIIPILSSASLALIVSISQYIFFTLIHKCFSGKEIADINVSISDKYTNKKEVCIKRENLKDNTTFYLRATVKVKVYRPNLFNLMKKLGSTVFIYAGPPDTLNFGRSSGDEYKRCRIMPDKGVFINCFFISRDGEYDEYSWDINFAAKIFDDSCSKINVFYGIALGTTNHKKLLKKGNINNKIFHIDKKYFVFKIKD